MQLYEWHCMWDEQTNPKEPRQQGVRVRSRFWLPLHRRVIPWTAFPAPSKGVSWRERYQEGRRIVTNKDWNRRMKAFPSRR